MAPYGSYGYFLKFSFLLGMLDIFIRIKKSDFNILFKIPWRMGQEEVAHNYMPLVTAVFVDKNCQCIPGRLIFPKLYLTK